MWRSRADLQAAEAELIKNRGVVINVSSISGVIAAQAPALVPYYIAKAAQVPAAPCAAYIGVDVWQQAWLLLAILCAAGEAAAPQRKVLPQETSARWLPYITCWLWPLLGRALLETFNGHCSH